MPNAHNKRFVKLHSDVAESAFYLFIWEDNREVNFETLKRVTYVR